MSIDGFIHLFCSHCEAVNEATGGQSLYHEDPIEPGMFMLENKMMRVKLLPNNAYVGRIGEDYFKKKDRDFARTHLSRLRTITSAEYSVERLASAEFDRCTYDLDIREGCLRIQIPSDLKVDVKENEFVDHWLNDLFGVHSDFIKNWLALYCYTNYQKLPVLLLSGDRGTGKTTFSEVVSSVFPDMSTDWIGDQQQFTPYFTKKLLMVEENYINKKSQYMLIKSVTGSEYLTVNEKYMPQYRVRNNASIILTTNEPRPLYLVSGEKPSSPDRNNFFIYQVPGIRQLNPRIKDEIRERFGHYVRTELHSRYKKWEAQQAQSTARYSIPCPITKFAEDLYDSAQTNIEADAEIIAEAIVMGYRDESGKKQNGWDFIKKAEFRMILKHLEMRLDNQQEYFRQLQDDKVVAYHETRSKLSRYGYQVLRSKKYYSDIGVTKMTKGDSLI